MLTYLLLQNRSDVGVGGVGGQSEYRPGQGVRQGSGGDGGSRRAGQRVRYNISCTWQIPQLVGILGDESQVALLAARGRRRDSVQGENQRLVIHPQFEWAALEPRAEVFNTCHGGEEFLVES